MICCKERNKKHWFRKLCMQWTELATVGFTTRPNKIFSLFFVLNISHMERQNNYHNMNHKFNIYSYFCVNYQTINLHHE